MEDKKTRPPITKEEREAVRQEVLNRKIFRYYELLSKWGPVPLMLGHWYGVLDYGLHHTPTVLDTDNNGACVVWLYVMAYVYMPMAMIPVSFFFRYCWIYRIPFLYFFGINAIRLYYGSWMIRPEQLEMHHIFIVFTIIMYAYGFAKIALENKRCRKNDRR